MRKGKGGPGFPCLIVYVPDGNSGDGPSPLPSTSTSRTPATTTTSVGQVYALMPKLLLRRRPGLLNVLKRNNIQLLSESHLTSMSSDEVKQLQIVEIRLSGSRSALVKPLDMICPSDCTAFVRRLFSQTTIQFRVVKRNNVKTPINASNVNVFQCLVSRSPEIPCTFGARSRGTLLHWALSLPRDQWINATSVLLEEGVDVNSLDSEQCTPLLRAIQSGRRLNMVQLLLKYGACANVACGSTSVLEEAYLFGRDRKRPSPVHQCILERRFSHPSQFRDSESQFRKILERILERMSTKDAVTGDWRSEFLCQHMVKILALHQLPEYDFLDNRLMSVINDVVPDKFRKMCEKELARLRDEKLGPNKIPAHELLLATDEKLGRLIENGSVSMSLIASRKKTVKKTYNCYGEILFQRLEEVENQLWLRKRDLPQSSTASTAEAVARGFSGKMAPGFPSEALDMYSRMLHAPFEPCHMVSAPGGSEEAAASLDLKEEQGSSPYEEEETGVKRQLPEGEDLGRERKKKFKQEPEMNPYEEGATGVKRQHPEMEDLGRECKRKFKQEQESNPNEEGVKGVKRQLPEVEDSGRECKRQCKEEQESNPSEEGAKGVKRQIPQIDENIPTKHIKLEDE